MNLQANRKSIIRIYPGARYGRIPELDQHIAYNAYLRPELRTQIKDTGEYVRNLTVARNTVATMLNLDIKVPFTEVDALIDKVRGKYDL